MNVTLSAPFGSATDDKAMTRVSLASLFFGRTGPTTQETRLTDDDAVAALVTVSRVDVADAPIFLSEDGSERFLAVVAAGRAPLTEPPLELDAF